MTTVNDMPDTILQAHLLTELSLQEMQQARRISRLERGIERLLERVVELEARP